MADEREESTTTVVLALAANAGVAVMKLVAGVVTGSGALLSEAAHSFGDTSTEGFLITALRRSDQPADGRHPFGYGKERYFWSLLAAVAIFVSGAVFSIYEGIHTIIEQPDQKLAWLNYAVLGAAAGLEGASLYKGVSQARGEARRQRRTLRNFLRDPDDPTVKSVVLEDSAALIGLALAAAGVGLHQLTGSAVYDGAASIAIGAPDARDRSPPGGATRGRRCRRHAHHADRHRRGAVVRAGGLHRHLHRRGTRTGLCPHRRVAARGVHRAGRDLPGTDAPRGRRDPRTGHEALRAFVD
jgi:Co/Zn/Cd efflux system component